MAGVCSRCNRHIYAAWRSANGRHYHPHCFTCAICDSVIQSVTKLEAANLKEIYCSGCFNQYFSKSDVANNEKNSISDLHLGELKASCEVLNSATSDTSHSFTNNRTNESGECTNETRPIDSDSQQHKNEHDERIANLIREADSHSEKRKQLCNKPIISLKRESTFIQQPIFTSRIPRPKSITNLKLSTTTSTNAVKAAIAEDKDVKVKKFPPMVPLKLHSTKINEYLCSKGMKFNDHSNKKIPFKPSIPMKAKHSIPDFSPTANTRKSLSRSQSFFKPIAPTISATGEPQSLQKRSPTFTKSFHQPLLSTSSRDFSLHNKSLTCFKPIESSLNKDKENSQTQFSTCLHEEPESIKTNSIKTTNSSILPLPTCQQLLSVMLNPGKEWPSKTSMEDRIKVSPLTFEKMERNTSKNHRESFNCPICFEALLQESGSGQQLPENIVTGCGHIFHRECIRNWLGKNGNNRCPICSSLCLRESIIPVYLEANITSDMQLKTNDNEGLAALLSTLRHDYQYLKTEYQTLVEQHKECGMKSAVTDSLRSAYEVECRNRVELQWENKRLHRKIEELRSLIQVAQGDTIPESTS